MNHDNARQHQEKETDLFVPLLLVVLSVLLMVVGQLIQIMQEREQLVARKASQEKPLQESRNVRDQFDSVTTGMTRLAAQGNPHAAMLLEELKKQGVTVSLPGESTQ